MYAIEDDSAWVLVSFSVHLSISEQNEKTRQINHRG